MEEKKKVPCEMTTYSNDLRRVIREKPCVTCDFRCGTCGWNPAEQRRRLRTGVWIKRKGISHLRFKRKGIDE